MKLTKRFWLILIVGTIVSLSGCAHNYFGVPNTEWETRRVGLGEYDMPATPPSAGPNSPWVASAAGAWGAGSNPAGMAKSGSHIGATLAYGSHAQDVNVDSILAQTTYDTIAYGSRAAFMLGGAKNGWAVGSSVSFPFDYTYNFNRGNQVAESSGMLTQVSLGGAVALDRYWAVGVEGYGIQGNQRITANYEGNHIDESRNYSGYDYGMGIQHRAEVWRGITLGFGVAGRRGATIERSDTGTWQLPPQAKAGIFGKYRIYRVSVEGSFRDWKETTTGDQLMDIAYSTFAEELRVGGAVDFLLGERHTVSAGYQRSSVPVRSDDGYRMYDSRYGVGGAFPVQAADVSLGLWFGTRGSLSRDDTTVNNIILSMGISML